MIDADNTMEIAALRKKSGSSGDGNAVFKTVMFGLDKNEVKEHINTLNLNIKRAQTSFDEKAEEMQNMISMLNREKEGYVSRIEKMKGQISDIENKNKEMSDKLAYANEMLANAERLQTENRKMSQEIKKYEGAYMEFEDLKKQLSDSNIRCGHLENSSQALKEENTKLKAEIAEQNSRIIEMERIYNTQMSDFKLTIFQTSRKNKYSLDQAKNMLNEILDNIKTVDGSFDEFLG